MKNVFIVTEIKIYKGTSPGSARLLNIAKALALQGVNVFLCSFTTLFNTIGVNKFFKIDENIYIVTDLPENKSLLMYYTNKLFHPLLVLQWILRIIKASKKIDGTKVFYVYPQPEVSIDIISLVLPKMLYRYRLFYDMNELRVSNLYNISFSKNFYRRILQRIMYPLRYFKYMLADKLTTFYDGLVVISTNLEQYYKQYNNHLLRVPILSNTEDVPLQLPSPYNASKTFRLGFAGSIALKKEGFDYFYKALALVKAKHENFELHLYGPIFDKDLLLDELPRQLGIKENVFYHGIINQEHLINEIQKNHLLVLPRPLNLQTQYGFSTKLSEYLVSGIPVLVTDVSDNALYIQDGYNGFIIPPGNSEIMAEKILYIVSNYESISETIAKNAYLTAKKYFNYKTHSNALCNFLFANDNQCIK